MDEEIQAKATGELIKDWDLFFFELADTTARKSKDRSTQVGCVIVGSRHEVRSLGYNGFARGVDDAREDWHERPKKYLVTAHAELNAICNAASTGTPLQGCTAYVTFPPCSACILALVQAGISTIKYYEADLPSNSKWGKEYVISEEICREAKVKLLGFLRGFSQSEGRLAKP